MKEFHAGTGSFEKLLAYIKSTFKNRNQKH